MLGVVVLTHTPSHPRMPAPRCCRIASWTTPPQNPSSPLGSCRPKPHLPGAASPSSALPPAPPQPSARRDVTKQTRAFRGARATPLPPIARARGGALTEGPVAGNGGIPSLVLIPIPIPFHGPVHTRSPQPCSCPRPYPLFQLPARPSVPIGRPRGVLGAGAGGGRCPGRESGAFLSGCGCWGERGVERG